MVNLNLRSLVTKDNGIEKKTSNRNRNRIEIEKKQIILERCILGPVFYTPHCNKMF